MATEVISLQSVDSNPWPILVGGNAVVAVASPDDDDTSYIESVGTTEVALFKCSLPNQVLLGDQITNIIVSIRAKASAAATVATATQDVSGVTATGNTGTSYNSLSYATKSVTFTTQPAGGAHTKASLDLLKIGANVASAVNGIKWTTGFVTITYTPTVSRTRASCSGAGR